MTTFYIVRHGESEANELGVIAGHSDYHLTALGKKQAEETAAHLSDVVLDAVYASDLARAMETAAPHAVPRGLTVIPSVQMRETFCGDWEGVSFAEVKAKDPEGYAAALSEFDAWLGGFLPTLGEEDLVLITADHGCDPGYAATTDHTREYVPLLVLGQAVKPGDLGTRNCFADIAATVAQVLGVSLETPGKSFAEEIL